MTASTQAASARILSVDILRGLVIVVMALDHVRDFFHLSPFAPEDLAQTNPAIFFTRWITHFCAPAFVFLSGLSAWLHAGRAGLTRNQLARFLALRGLWLIAVEIIVINFAWQFGYGFIFLQVIWAIGVSMIALAALIYLPLPAILAVSIVMITGHNLLDSLTSSDFGGAGWIWKFIHEQTWIALPDSAPVSGILVAYPVIPWIGVMSLGYAGGKIFEMAPQQRDRFLLTAGLTMIAAFIALRGVNIYGDPSPWAPQERGGVFTLLSFLNTSKYPPSLLFLLMTLGPALALMPLLERLRGPIGGFFATFGKVPFFFYVLHLFLIHLLAIVWFGATADAWAPDIFNPATLPAAAPSLLRVYIATIIVVALLYVPCRWFGAFKKRHRDWGWLSYL